MILITGSTGFIGSRLVSFLSQKGYEIKEVNEEITDIEKLRPHFKGADFVVHLAGKKPNSETVGKSNDTFLVNVLGTMNVVRLCLENKSKLINISSSATESEYGISKVVAEELVRSYAKSQGLKAITIRPAGIYDENDKTVPYINKNYPLGHLVRDIEWIIKNHNFDQYKVYETRNFQQKIYFIRRKINAVKRRVNKLSSWLRFQ
ncbi:MAG: hypothetical protein A3B99_04330 [Candidatus Yanofskybacteria bacterium RIFCSPHIGHO2_02_FULL_44_12b]|uniref:NAD-dependent epimerase/dehydratase domain-containing protein n=2 Tax=Candidatus Yanofskyibacteriota TaxID=1752733 RepID=A0A1F8GQ69_9BACT|nr:MAG: UDP-glucose 4-epimerase [Candidatus Yanofskybacteria bacterium GW2011_GWA2_44_9]OGN04594.1 MAG: hypothetical protein A2659_00510 [Candidatus Yanofskybacteria bacterium RIFCSPHIGHO2_01_FULL_44_24]OGN15740.1 MAG: hypothetical protein A3B99_04330 [Candidatus Yanofskybacteria bacterium RIFCSPHIGHO2_02_FULL_44_12b]OGN26796.1 MAG: hypothetical protein A2925_04415 [Candidatus Yanofskybacteria bacterium RIFCSPLOWO2_01_FULL_44_22]